MEQECSFQVARAESRGAFWPGLLLPRFHVRNPFPRLSPTVAWKLLPPSERSMVAKARFLYSVVPEREVPGTQAFVHTCKKSANFLKPDLIREVPSNEAVSHRVT